MTQITNTVLGFVLFTCLLVALPFLALWFCIDWISIKRSGK